MAFINYNSNKEPLWGNVGSELQKMDPRSGTGWAPDYASLGFWGGGEPMMSAFDRQMRDIAAAREDRTKMDIANVGAESANQAQMVQLLKALYGEFPLARATLENKQSNDAMQRQIDIMRMIQGDKTALEKARIGAGATLGAAQLNKEGRENAAAGKVPNVPLAPIEFKGPKMQEIQANAPIDKATGKPIKIPQSELEVLAQKEWINYMTGAKVDVRDSIRQQRQQPPTAAPQKTSMSLDDSMGRVAMGDFMPQAQYGSAQIVPGSETTSPEMESLIMQGVPLKQGFSGQPAVNGSFAGTGDYGDSGTVAGLKRAYPNQSPMYQNREIQENIAAGYQKPFMSAADMAREQNIPPALKQIDPWVTWQRDDYTGMPKSQPQTQTPQQRPLEKENLRAFLNLLGLGNYQTSGRGSSYNPYTRTGKRFGEL